MEFSKFTNNKIDVLGSFFKQSAQEDLMVNVVFFEKSSFVKICKIKQTYIFMIGTYKKENKLSINILSDFRHKDLLDFRSDIIILN